MGRGAMKVIQLVPYNGRPSAMLPSPPPLLFHPLPPRTTMRLGPPLARGVRSCSATLSSTLQTPLTTSVWVPSQLTAACAARGTAARARRRVTHPAPAKERKRIVACGFLVYGGVKVIGELFCAWRGAPGSWSICRRSSRWRTGGGRAPAPCWLATVSRSACPSPASHPSLSHASVAEGRRLATSGPPAGANLATTLLRWPWWPRQGLRPIRPGGIWCSHGACRCHRRRPTSGVVWMNRCSPLVTASGGGG